MSAQFETQVSFRGEKREVTFDYEGDGVIVWAFDDEDVCLGKYTTEAEQQQIFEHLWAFMEDWWSHCNDPD